MSSVYTSLTYERSIATVRKGLGVEGDTLDFLDDADAVIAWIDGSKYKPNSKKTYYIAIVATLKKNDLFPFALEQYKAKMDTLNNEVAVKAMDQQLSEAEKAKYLEWPQILEAYERIRLAAHDLQTFQEYLIASLYVLQPPVRLDYANMRVVNEEPAMSVAQGANYLVLSKNPYFLFTDYKTYNNHGAQRIPLSAGLCDVIQEWRTLMHDDYLLIGTNGGPMKEWDLGQTLIRTFEKHSGKSVGANILRHSYDSWMRRNEMTYKQSSTLANQMMHSQSMSHLYRRLT